MYPGGVNRPEAPDVLFRGEVLYLGVKEAEADSVA
jgi:hypothetical protein